MTKNKINHVWSVACQSSVIDGSTNNISIFNTLEEVQIDIKPQKPGEKVEINGPINLPMHFDIISLWHRDNVSKDFIADNQIDFLSPNGKVLQSFTQPFVFKDSKKRWRTKLQVDGLLVDDEGDYSFQVKLREPDQTSFRVVATIPLEVKIKIHK